MGMLNSIVIYLMDDYVSWWKKGVVEVLRKGLHPSW